MKKTIISLVALSLLALPVVALAQNGNYGLENAADLGLGSNSLIDTITNVIGVLLSLLGILAVLLILWGGFLWMTAAGDTDKVDKAKKLIISGVVGIVIIFSAYAIASFVIDNMATATGATT